MDRAAMIIVAVIWAAMVILRFLNYVSLTSFRIVLLVVLVLYIVFLNRNRIFGKKKK